MATIADRLVGGTLSVVGALVLCTLLCSLAGCSSEPITITVPESGPIRPSGYFRAGATRVDITPQLGLPPFGFSLAAKHDQFRGVRTRLWARVIVIEDTNGERLAMIGLDLGCASSLLHWSVAKKVAESTGLGVDRILMAATHTHSGPSGYCSAAIYNRFGSPSLWTSFDPALTAKLTKLIADGIEEAVRSLAKAKCRAGQREILNLTYNRSSAAYEANPGVSNDQEPLVDRTMTMVRIDRADDQGTIAAWIVFAGHPAIVGTGNDLWHGDVFGIASLLLEQEFSKGSDPPPVFALANGTEGDVSFLPKDRERGQEDGQDHEVALRRGGELALEAKALFEDLGRGRGGSIELAHAYKEIALRGANAGQGKRLCANAQFGMAVGAGAEDGRSCLHPCLVREGQRRLFPLGCQAEKSPFLWPLQGIFPKQDWPSIAPLQVFRLGDVYFLATPFEATTMSGQQIRRAFAKTIGCDPEKNVVLISLANDYHGYCTTQQEYAKQHYEGASTLYGPHVADFLEKEFSALAASFSPGPPTVDVSTTRTFFPGRPRPITRDPSGVCVGRYGRRVIPGNTTITFEWIDTHPENIDIRSGPLVTVQQQGTNGAWDSLKVGGIVEDDLGLRMEIRLVDRQALGCRWQVVWWYPQLDDTNARYRFQIAPRDGRDAISSCSFVIPTTAAAVQVTP